ncbi:SusC/RagA family TonB-linked outer membrane protein [Flavobacterium subsaxonicum]|uniref:TonB-dependent receptor n=1 Tax=Flavobacterium subsaxonicum WB 4.1-42 = DSM 21790 TaxID=1121898 RepID=A0A0A2MG28_9FLAO|nr:TonB-dependent receptor [Flavobacterium subsaxonicum]KGO91204.1 TonB-dependent receptor [Flavobacterium subsaxonicum WB 4.1-42 = DSM 21790]
MKSKICIPPKVLTFCLSFVFALLALPAFAQQQTITGKIIAAEDGLGLPGVNIIEKGTTNGVSADIDGNYSISVNPNATLVFSFVGYATQEVAANGQTAINITLVSSASELNEIVVVGYGTQKRKVSTAATTVVSGKDLQQTNSIDATSALQGQSSGVSITSTSGQPGAAMTVNIRGVGTAGNSTPLYVVDGVVVDNGIGYLDPSSIERIDVLKDAAAASIYGARAANGVVLVTTKKGADGKMNVSLNSYTGFQEAYKRLDLLNAQQYGTIMNEARVNSGLAPLYTQQQIDSAPNNNWQDELFNDGAMKQNHSLLINGGDSKATYSTGLSYYGQDGLIGGQTNQSSYDRITFTANTTFNVIKDRLKVGQNFSYAKIKSTGVADDGIYVNSIRSFLNAPPNYATYDENGDYGRSDISADIANPLGALYYTNFNENKINRYVGNIFAELTFARNFTFRTSFGIDISDSSYRSFVPIYELSSVTYNTVSSVTQSSNQNFSWIWDNTLQYKTSLGKHNIDVLVGTSARERNLEYQSATGRNLIFDDFKHAYLDTATDRTQNTVSGGRTPYNIQSYFGRMLYDYDNKYLFTATIRRDGSSEFGPNNKYAYFPAFSAGWNVDQEGFFPEESAVSSLKIRGSWGQNGNDQFSRQFAYMSTISSYDKNYHFGTGTNELPLQVGSSPDALSNPNLKWETSEQLNIGFDATLFRNLTLTVDYYDKQTKDWLVQASVPEIAGAQAPFINGGDVTNKGFEIGLGYNAKLSDDWHLTVNANLSKNKNEVTRIANQNGIIYGDANLLFQGIDEINRVQEGHPIGYFYGLKTDGIFQNTAEVAAYSQNGTPIQPSAQPGDVKFVDLNGDGRINADDKTEIGDPNPDYYYGFSLQLNYKAFDFSVFTYGVAGNQVAYGVRDYGRPFNNYTTDVFDRWTTEGSSNTTPRVTYGTTDNGNYTKFSDLFLQDAGFFRIKTVTIGCDLAKLTKFLGDSFSQFRIYGSANNLFTFTDYKGLDPEVGFGNTNQTWARGIDVGFYPQPRTYMIGLSANF